MQRLLILLCLLLATSNACAQLLFKRDPSAPLEPTTQANTNIQTSNPADGIPPASKNTPFNPDTPLAAQAQDTTNSVIPPLIDIERIKSSQNPKLEAAWYLAKLDSFWTTIKRKIIIDDPDTDPDEKPLSKEEVGIFIDNSGLEINTHDRKIIETSGYTVTLLEKYVQYQKSINALKSIMGKPGPLELLTGSLALATDSIVLILFLSIGFIANKYRTCIILALCYGAVLSLIMVKGQLPWSNLDHFNGWMWCLMISFGGIPVTLLAYTAKKVFQYIKKNAQKNNSEEIKLLTFNKDTPPSTLH